MINELRAHNAAGNSRHRWGYVKQLISYSTSLKNSWKINGLINMMFFRFYASKFVMPAIYVSDNARMSSIRVDVVQL